MPSYRRPAAGSRDRRIVIQSVTTTVSETGIPVETWANFLTLRAAKREITARERFRANQEIGEEVATFEVPFHSGITSEMRLIHDGKTYQLAPPVEIGRREALELTGTVVRA